MSDEPNLPPIPDIGEIVDRKDRLFEKVHTVIKCDKCQNVFSRDFKPGDYVFKKITDDACTKCNLTKSTTIIEIYSEWIDPKKQK